MKLRETITKHSFLFRILFTLFILICIPVLLYSYSVVKRAYVEYQAATMANYKAELARYSVQFSNEFNKLRIVAARIGYERKVTLGYVTEKPYNVLESMAILNNYKAHVPIVSRVGLYFGNEFIYTNQGRISLAGYLAESSGAISSNGAEVKYDETSAICKQILDNVKSFRGNYLIYSTFGKVDQSEKLYVFIPVASKSLFSDHAMVIFEITSDSFKYSTGKNDLLKNYYFGIFDENNNLVYSDNKVLPHIAESTEQIELFKNAGNNGTALTVDEFEYTALRMEQPKLNMNFALLVSKADTETSLEVFFWTIWNSVSWVTAFFVLLCVGAGYLNYRPIVTLLKKLKNFGVGSDNRIQNEFNTIYSVIEDMNHRTIEMNKTISVQQDQISNNLFTRLIEGISIDAEEIKQLNLMKRGPFYCVLLMAAPSIDERELHHFINNVSRNKNVIHIVDIPSSVKVAIVCSLTDNSRASRQEIAEAVQHGIVESGMSCDRIGVGTAQHALSDIRISYLTAISSYESDQQFTHLILFEDVVETYTNINIYPTEAILKLIQCIKHGDKEHAIKEMDDIAEYIGKNIPLSVMKRYFYFSIVNVLVTSLNKLDVEVTIEEIDGMMRYDNITSYRNALREFIIKTCDKIAEKQKIQSNELIHSIVRYVDDNYVNPDMGLSMVSDKFNLPVYTVSRLYKRATNVGLNEYVVLKRVEYSKLQMFISPDKSIKEIAAQSGFRDVSYFIKTFKKICGSTPKRYNH